jgi:hypothetical protein
VVHMDDNDPICSVDDADLIHMDDNGVRRSAA